MMTGGGWPHMRSLPFTEQSQQSTLYLDMLQGLYIACIPDHSSSGHLKAHGSPAHEKLFGIVLVNDTHHFMWAGLAAIRACLQCRCC